jgi:phosphoribosylformylglycinamidine synthase I
VKVGIVIFPGSNCDHDMYYATKKMIGDDTHFIWHQEVSLKGYDAVVLPGGFSYGDYLRAGAIARFSPILREIMNFAGRGGKVLGICNGFQVLTESGLLPGALMRNRNLRFVCKYINIRVENSETIFTNRMKRSQILKIPVAHGEGNFFIDDNGYQALVDNNQIVFRYCSLNGEITERDNPNGSLEAIAGIINEHGNVIGMMPHPERAVDQLLGSADGRYLFESMIS